MFNRLLRNYNHRFPLYGDNHEGMGKVTIIGGSIVAVLIGIISIHRWRKSELSKKKIELFRAVDPNQIIPLRKDLGDIDIEMLRKAVSEGGDKFIHDELGYRLFRSPEEYVYYTTSGVSGKEREEYLEYLRRKFDEL